MTPSFRPVRDSVWGVQRYCLGWQGSTSRPPPDADSAFWLWIMGCECVQWGGGNRGLDCTGLPCQSVSVSWASACILIAAHAFRNNGTVACGGRPMLSERLSHAVRNNGTVVCVGCPMLSERLSHTVRNNGIVACVGCQWPRTPSLRAMPDGRRGRE